MHERPLDLSVINPPPSVSGRDVYPPSIAKSSDKMSGPKANHRINIYRIHVYSLSLYQRGSYITNMQNLITIGSIKIYI